MCGACCTSDCNRPPCTARGPATLVGFIGELSIQTVIHSIHHFTRAGIDGLSVFLRCHIGSAVGYPEAVTKESR
jgi:hypothetical protein